MNRQIVWILFLFFIITHARVVYCSGEFDATAVVSSVADGDTFGTTSEGTIRLADVDAPETFEVGYDCYNDPDAIRIGLSYWGNCKQVKHKVSWFEKKDFHSGLHCEHYGNYWMCRFVDWIRYPKL